MIYKRIHRPQPALLARAAACTMSDLYECMGSERDKGLMHPSLRPLVATARACGPAITAQCAPGDNLMMHKALLLAEAGDVLVIVSEGASAAQWGDLAARYAAYKGLAGVIVDGPIRDAPALLEMGYPVWSTAISPAHPDKRAGGTVNMPVRCAGAQVRPGDIISADLDGVLVMPRERLEDIVAKTEHRAAHETEALAAIKAGKSLFEIHQIDQAFAALQLREIDGAWEAD